MYICHTVGLLYMYVCIYIYINTYTYIISRDNFLIFKVSTFSGTLCQPKGKRAGQTFRCQYRQTINRPWLWFLTVPVADAYRQLSSQKDTLFLEMTLCSLLWQFVGGTLVSACSSQY